MILLFLIVWGLFAGWIANLILGGGMRPDNWGRLLVAGVVRSFVGGLLSNLLAGDGWPCARRDWWGRSWAR